MPAEGLRHVPTDEKAERPTTDGDDDVRAHRLGPFGGLWEVGDDNGQDHEEDRAAPRP